jgi:stearoyl-CoA desaturase (delta-9 desaturase)
MNMFKPTNTNMVWGNRIIMTSAAVAPIVAFFQFNPVLVIAALVLWQVLNVVGISVGVHRYYSHKAFETHRFWQWVMSYCAMVSLVGPPCIWADTHMTHHRKADTPEDPYRKLQLTGESPFDHKTTVSKRFLLSMISRDPLHQLTIKYYWLYVASYVVGMTALGMLAGLNAFEAVFWLWMVPAGMSQLTLRFVLWTGHVKGLGYQTYDNGDLSNNWWFASLIAGGEGWHNNHHKRPKRAKLGEKWWEFDPGYWFICLIRSKKTEAA